MATADYFYPDRGCLVDFFAIRGWKINQDIEPSTFDLSFQSGAFDHFAMATPFW